MAGRKPQPQAASRVDKTRSVLSDLTGLLRALSDLLRELAAVVGWVVVLLSTCDLIVRGHISPTELIPPGGGALAALQRYVRPRTDRAGKDEIPDNGQA